MKIMYTNSLHNNYTETKNNKTQNGMTNNVSFKARKQPTPKTCKKAINALAQNTQNIYFEAISTINKALMKDRKKHMTINNFEKQINHIKVNNTESVEETFKDAYNREITLLDPKYDEETNKLIFCKQITRKYKNYVYEQDIYENAKFNPISEKLESCDKFTRIFNKDSKKAFDEKLTYIKPKFSLEDDSSISDWIIFFDKSIEDYLNNDYNTNKVSQIIKTTPILNEWSNIIGCEKYEKKYGFKTRGLINETYLMYNDRENLASKVIRKYKGEENNGLCKEIYYNAIPSSLKDCEKYDKIYKLTDKNGVNIEPEYYPNGILKTCYKYVRKNKDQVKTYINSSWSENGKIRECEKHNILIKEFNDDGQLSTIRNINVEHPEFDIDGNMVCSELINITTKAFNLDGQLSTTHDVNIEHPEFDTNGNMVCCKLRKSTFKYIIPQFDVVEDNQTFNNVRYYVDGNMKFCEKMLEEVKRVKKDEQNRNIIYSIDTISTNVKFNENGSLDTIEKRERNCISGIKKSEFNIKYTTQGNNDYNTELILFSNKNSPYYTLAFNSHVKALGNSLRSASINMATNMSIMDTCMFVIFKEKIQIFCLKPTIWVSPDGICTNSKNYTRFPNFPDVPNFPEFESFSKVTVARPIMPARIYKEDELEEQKTNEYKDGIYIMTKFDERIKRPAINIYDEDFKSWPEQEQKIYLNNYNNVKKCINFLDKKFSEVPKFKFISAINSKFGIKEPRRGIIPIPSYAEEVVETNHPQNEVKEAKDFEEVKEIMPNVLEKLNDFLMN